jgi:MSHA biogenesis protein MshP
MNKTSSGFVLVSALFLLVVIAALGLFTVTISTSQQQDSAMDAQGSRAYQAAKAGLEWGVYQLTKNNATCDSLMTAAQPLTMPTGTQLSAFKVYISCTVNAMPLTLPPTTSTPAYTDGDATFCVYQLISLATTGTQGSLGYFERQVQLSIYQAPTNGSGSCS